MKKILSVFTAVLLLGAVVFSMASCGSANMDDIKKDLEILKGQSKITYSESTDDADEGIIRQFTVYSKEDLSDVDETERLVIFQCKTTDLAKAYYDMYRFTLESEEEYKEIQEDMNEALANAGLATDTIDSTYDKVIKRKGDVVIYGSEELYEEIFG